MRDPAGGGLSLAMTLKLSDTGIDLPKWLVLGSPWAALSQEGHNYTYNRKNDEGFGSDREDAIGTNVLPIDYTEGDSVYNSYIYPVYADYDGMPSMLIQTGSREMLLSDGQTAIDKAKEAGVNVEFNLFDGMFSIMDLRSLLNKKRHGKILLNI